MKSTLNCILGTDAKIFYHYQTERNRVFDGYKSIPGVPTSLKYVKKRPNKKGEISDFNIVNGSKCAPLIGSKCPRFIGSKFEFTPFLLGQNSKFTPFYSVNIL